MTRLTHVLPKEENGYCKKKTSAHIHVKVTKTRDQIAYLKKQFWYRKPYVFSNRQGNQEHDTTQGNERNSPSQPNKAQ